MKLKTVSLIILLDIALIVIVLVALTTQTGDLHRQATEEVSNDIAVETVIDEPPPFQEISLYGVLLEDKGVNGKFIGCQDSLVPVRVYESEQYRYKPGKDRMGNPSLHTYEGAVTEAVRELIGLSNEHLESTFDAGSFYTATYQPSLTVDGVEKNGDIANVFLRGEILLGGACDNPRFKEQLNATATQFSDINFARFHLNGSEQEFENVMSAR